MFIYKVQIEDPCLKVLEVNRNHSHFFYILFLFSLLVLFEATLKVGIFLSLIKLEL